MTRVSASAPGKIILFGEHAVVYGQPAVAVPVHAVASTAVLEFGTSSNGLTIELPDLGRKFLLSKSTETDPISIVIRHSLAKFGLTEPSATLTVSSTIPIASGLGSGASVSASICRVLAACSGKSISDSEVSTIVFKSEKVYHGTPSGIDNSVICFEKPIFFVKGLQPTVLEVGKPIRIVIADSGIPSPTKTAVASVRALFDRDQKGIQQVFDAIGQLSNRAADCITSGDTVELGALMNQNHSFLQQLGVSSLKLDNLVHVARMAGAAGAKLSGGGLGGNIIAYPPEDEEPVVEALKAAGATHVWTTQIG